MVTLTTQKEIGANYEPVPALAAPRDLTVYVRGELKPQVKHVRYEPARQGYTSVPNDPDKIRG